MSVDRVGNQSTNRDLTNAGSSSGAGGVSSTGGASTPTAAGGSVSATGGGSSTPTAAGGSVSDTGGASSTPAAGRSGSAIPVPSSGGRESGGRGNGGTPGRGSSGDSGLAGAAGAAEVSPTHYALAGLTSDGEVIAAYWTGTEEAVVLLDPQTMGRTDVGTLGDLYLWSSQFIYDDKSRMAYAVGQSSAGQTNVYSFSLDDRQTTAAPLAGLDSANVVLGGVTVSGSIVAATWVGPAEALVQIDPATGKSDTVGSIDGLEDWNNQLVYDGATRTAYALGHAGDREDNYVFTSNLDSGETSRVLLEPTTNGAVLGGIDSDANLLAAYWDGSRELVVTLDPATAATKTLGYLDGLEEWDEQLVYSEARQTLVAYGFGAGSRDAGLYVLRLDQ